MVRRLLCMMAWLGLSAALPAAGMAATFAVTVDHTITSSDHTLQMVARLEGSSDNFSLDITPLEKDFYVTAEPDLKRAGQWREKHYRIGAKRHGVLKVPALRVTVGGKKLFSQPFQITILAADGDVDDVRLWVEDRLGGKHAWLHQQLTWQMRVLSTYPFAAVPDVQFPSFEGFDVRKLDSAVAGSVVKNGRRLFTMTWVYLLYPRHTGDLHITQPAVSARLAQHVKTHRIASGNPNFDAGETRIHTKKAHGKPLLIRVHTLPLAATGLPVGHLAITSELPDAHAFALEPLTWNIHLSGQAIRLADMPVLWKYLSLDDGLQTVREKPLVTMGRDGLQTKVDVLYRLILTPSKAGNLHIPTVDIAFFNPDQGRIEHAMLASRSVQVAPPRQSQGDEGFALSVSGSKHGSARQHSATVWWKWLAIGMFILWSLTIVAWFCWGRANKPCWRLPAWRYRARAPSMRKLLAERDATVQFSAIKAVSGLPARITPLGLLAFFPDLQDGAGEVDGPGNEGGAIATWLAALERGRWQHGELPPPLDELQVREMIRVIDAAIQSGGKVGTAAFDPAEFGRIGSYMEPTTVMH